MEEITWDEEEVVLPIKKLVIRILAEIKLQIKVQFLLQNVTLNGYEAVFRQKHEPNKTYDLTIKTSNDKDFIKNIEVKQITSNNVSKIAPRINEANQQISREDTIAIVLAKHKNDNNGRAFAKAGINEARRKGYIKGKIEVWFSDKTKIVF